ncbi:MAG: DUF2946 domain-containing protein [Rhodanobacter sp.]|jgi:hypothetical protein|nr:DUF2946 domain-containing protein [Rhodanobacter sp.]
MPTTQRPVIRLTRTRIRTRTIRSRWGWLALAAIWLTIVAPVVSQTLGSRAAAMNGSCAQQANPLDSSATPHPRPPPHPMTFCGYCSLFQHSSVLASLDWQPSLLPPAAFRPLVATPFPSWSGHSILAAAPRGPPISVHR